MTQELELLLEKRRARVSRDEFPLANFYEKIKRARLLLDYAETKVGLNARALKSEARRQFVISLITALEVYLGDLTIELIDRTGVRYGKNILNSAQKKYNLIEVREILKNKITMGELICEQINFQNLDVVFAFLKNLFGKDISRMLEENKFTYTSIKGDSVAVYLRKGFGRNLNMIFKMRHDFVHDIRFNRTPLPAQLRKHQTLIRTFAVCIDVVADGHRKVKGSKIVKK